MSVTLLRPMVRALAELGCDHGAVLAEAGLAPEDLQRADLRIPHSAAMRTFMRALAVTNEPSFGLRCAAHMDLGDLGLFGMLLVTSATVGEGIERAHRFGRLLHDATRDWGERRGDAYYWYVAFAELELPQLLLESVIAGNVVRIRFRAGESWAPREVWFRHPKPDYEAAYQRLFRCPVRCGAERDAIVIDAAMLDWPNYAVSEVSALLERRAEAALSEIAASTSFAERTRARLLATLGRGAMSSEELAKQLHVSRATLTRRLKQEGTTLSGLLDEVRRDLALEYLRDPKLSVEELARRLDFSDARSFRRAFCRWTGTTPAAHRLRAR